jgi:hypothetical protein
MKNRDEDLNRVETVTTIVVNIGTIISWIITLITALTLIAQPRPIVIPGILELGKPYAITFLISVLFGYIQLLRHFWRRSGFTKTETENGFASYMYMSIVKFKRPFVLLGFAPILIALAQVEPVGFGFISFLTIIISLSVVFAGFEDSSDNPFRNFVWKLDDEFYKRWLKRVKNQLYDCGYVFTTDFANLDIDENQINWAIENYFNRHEFEQDLVLTKRSYRKLLEDHQFLELRFAHLPTRLKKEQES